MTIELADDVAAMLTERAVARGLTPPEAVAEMLRERLPPPTVIETLQRREPPLTVEEWERYFGSFGRPYGVALTDEQLSSECLYD